MNAKGDLIARLLTLGLGTPTFDTAVEGPPHDRTFTVTASAGGHALGQGKGRNKRDAERLAAEAALEFLEKGGQKVFTEPAYRWPIYAVVLGSALDAALDMAPETASLDDVKESAVKLYRDLLTELGHGPEQETE